MSYESPIKSVAALLTCFNRKEKTLKCLDHLFAAWEQLSDGIEIDIYLTDDLSTDGTAQAVESHYPHVNILTGSGELYWAGGMRNSWSTALTKDYDAYLLLNDDTFMEPDAINELLATHRYSIATYNKPGIYIGSTLGEESGKFSYGGAVFTNRFLGKYYYVIPNGHTPQQCELGNANIMLVPRKVVDEIGILSDAYVHALADYDYTLLAVKNGIPVLVCPNYIGVCTDDHNDPYETFHNLTLRERIQKLRHPVGLDFKSHLQYMKRHFPIRMPIVFVMGWFKVIFPRAYNTYFQKNR